MKFTKTFCLLLITISLSAVFSKKVSENNKLTKDPEAGPSRKVFFNFK